MQKRVNKFFLKKRKRKRKEVKKKEKKIEVYKGKQELTKNKK